MPASSRLHIVLAITLAVPGGATSFVMDYALWLTKQGHRVTLLAGEGTWLFTEAAKAGIPCIRIPWMQREIRPWLDLPALFALTKQLRTLKPDVIHLNSSKMGVIGSIAARLSMVPRVVYCIGGWAFLESIPSWKRSIYSIAEYLTAPLKDVIVCLHPNDVRAAQERNIHPKEGLRVIPNGVDIQLLDRLRLSRKEAREKLAIPQDAFVLGTIANFYPAKGLPSYIRSATPVLQANPATRIVIIGDGPERSCIEAAIQESGVSGQILLTGSLAQAHVFLEAFDVFVLPSTKEGMPFSLLEAMAARLPCIVTDVGAHAWMLERTGSFVINPSDTVALEQALRHAFHQRGLLTDIGEANRTSLERRFPLEATFTSHEQACFPR